VNTIFVYWLFVSSFYTPPGVFFIVIFSLLLAIFCIISLGLDTYLEKAYNLLGGE